MIDYKKMIDIVAKTYINKCTNEKLFSSGKMNPVYFMVRATLLKKDYTEVKTLCDYVTTIEDKCIMSLTDLFKQAEEYRRDAFVSREPIQEARQERYSLDKLLSM